MRITNSFFNTADPAPHIYVMPPSCIPSVGLGFAEFEAARNAIVGAFPHANWDGYGALPIREETKDNALAALDQLTVSTCAPEISPNPNGTLSFQWETSRGFGQLEVGRTRYSLCIQPRHGSPIMEAGMASEIDPTVGHLLDALLYPKPSRPLSRIHP